MADSQRQRERAQGIRNKKHFAHGVRLALRSVSRSPLKFNREPGGDAVLLHLSHVLLDGPLDSIYVPCCCVESFLSPLLYKPVHVVTFELGLPAA